MSSPQQRAIDGLPMSFTYADARAGGLSDHALRALVHQGVLVRLGRGAYRRADAPLADEDLVEIALRAPDATLCLATALARHDLTDRIASDIDVALPRRQRPPRCTAPARWHRFDERTFAVGREALIVDDSVTIGLYSAERCVLDALRLRHLVGEELAIEALRTWLRRPEAVPASLLAMARDFPSVEPVLLAALRVLL